MQETRNNFFGSKKCSTTLRQAKTGKHECQKLTAIAVTFRLSCLPVIAWRWVVLHFFAPKQLLRVSCILWCYLSKGFSTIFQNVSLWCCIFIQSIITSFCFTFKTINYFFFYGFHLFTVKSVSHVSKNWICRWKVIWNLLFKR